MIIEEQRKQALEQLLSDSDGYFKISKRKDMSEYKSASIYDVEYDYHIVHTYAVTENIHDLTDTDDCFIEEVNGKQFYIVIIDY